MMVSRKAERKSDGGPVQFVEKEPTLAEAVLRALLRFWPLTNSQKEVRSLHYAPAWRPIHSHLVSLPSGCRCAAQMPLSTVHWNIIPPDGTWSLHPCTSCVWKCVPVHSFVVLGFRSFAG